MIIACASTRRESRGLHYTIDYPEPREDYARDTLIVHGEPPHLSGR
jgi:L-aspartate oxidase